LLSLAPHLQVIAVDLPGRATKSADLSRVTLDEWIDSVVDDIDAAGIETAVVAAHSLGGITAPGVVARLGRDRALEMVMVAAFVPPHGSSVLDALGGPLALLARPAVATGMTFPMPVVRLIARQAFWNGMSPQSIRFARSRLYLDASKPLLAATDLSGLPADVSRTWVLTGRDRALSRRQQHRGIVALGGVDRILHIDTCHDVMFSEPSLLAGILLQRCQAHALAN
jgi:pimeloyl-ACP methyl ester carboxylesterase